MKKNSDYNEIRKLIGDDEIEKALDKIIGLADSTKNVDASHTGVLLLSRLRNLEKETSNGTITKEEKDRDRTKIAKSALDEIINLKKYTDAFVDKKVPEKSFLLTEQAVFEIAMSANIIIELEKVKESFYDAEWDKRADILGSLSKYSRHSNLKVSREVLNFLQSVASRTRSGMKADSASMVESLLIHYLPYREEGNDMSFRCINIADNIFYDAAIYLKDIKVGIKALQVLKWIYWRGKEDGIGEIMNKVKETYKKLEETLDRPDVEGLEPSKELLKIFRDDLDNWGAAYPILPKYLLESL